MTNDNGANPALIQLLKDWLELRECAMTLAIHQRDVTLAAAVAHGLDTEIHRILSGYAVRAQTELESAPRPERSYFDTGLGIGLIALDDTTKLSEAVKVADQYMELKMYDEMMSALHDHVDDIIEQVKGFPLLYLNEMPNTELIELLKAEEDKQREEQEQIEADAAMASTS